MKNLLFFQLLVLIFFIQCTNAQKMEIIPIKPYSEEGTVTGDSTAKYKLKYYLVKNYKPTRNNFSQIDSFVFKNLDKNYSEYNDYQMIFYKKSASLNENFVPADENRIEWQGANLIVIYIWQKGIYAIYEQYENGKIKGSKVYTEDGKIIRYDKKMKVQPVAEKN